MQQKLKPAFYFDEPQDQLLDLRVNQRKEITNKATTSNYVPNTIPSIYTHAQNSSVNLILVNSATMLTNAQITRPIQTSSTAHIRTVLNYIQLEQTEKKATYYGNF